MSPSAGVTEVDIDSHLVVFECNDLGDLKLP
jgi:hypothetical protein